MRNLLLILAGCLLALSGQAAFGQSGGASEYVFIPEQSTITQTGGIAGVHRTYSIEGRFQLQIDPEVGTASLVRIDADAVDDSDGRYTLDPNEVFSLTDLAGTVVDETSIRFEGKTDDGSSVLITLTFADDTVALNGGTTPPPNSADFFIFALEAVARRKYGGGAGEPNDPYLIYTAEQVNAIGSEPNDWDKHFALAADVDLSAYPGSLSDDIERFSGTFDGRNHTISHFTWTASEGTHSRNSLFASLIPPGVVKNLRLEDVDVNVPKGSRIGGLIGYNDGGEILHCSVTGTIVSHSGSRIGGLVGHSYRGRISECSAAVDVYGTSCVGGLVGQNGRNEVSRSHAHGRVQGSSRLGGLIGQVSKESMISDSNATGDVSADTRYAGGLIGHIEEDATISGCHATGNVFDRGGVVGGLVGRCSGQTAISRSYATGDVSTEGGDAGGLLGYGGGTIDNSYYIGSVSAGGDNVGGLVGLYKGTITNAYAQGVVCSAGDHVRGLVGRNEGTIMNCYAVAGSCIPKQRGGLVGTNDGLVVDSFWDKEASGISYSEGGEGKSTAAMMDPNTFIPWACSTSGIWTIDTHSDYPRLAWEGLPGEPIAPPAEPGGYYDGGAGEPNDPYRIATPLHLWRIGMYSCDWDKHFLLVADVNLADHDYEDRPFRAIGWRGNEDDPRVGSFNGTFDGDDHSISHFYWPSTNERMYSGLFGWLRSEGKIANLRMENLIIERHIFGTFVGGLAACNEGAIENCHVTGEVAGNHCVGGLVGQNDGGHVYDCSSTALVSGNRHVGGLVGYSDGQGTIHRSFATGPVFSGPNEVGVTGGLVGVMVGGDVNDCYAQGDVESNKEVGGLIGRCHGATIRHSYATGRVTGGTDVGGLVGLCMECTIEDCLWDIDTSEMIVSCGGTGLITAEMQIAATFLDAGWDFVGETDNGVEDIWWILEGRDYPRLWWELPADDFEDGQAGPLWFVYEMTPEWVWLEEVNGRLEAHTTGQMEDVDALYVSDGWRLDATKAFAVRVDFHFSKVGVGDGRVTLGLVPTLDQPVTQWAQFEVGAFDADPFYLYEVRDGVWVEEKVADRFADDGTLYVSYDPQTDELHLSDAGCGEANARWTVAGLVQGRWQSGSVYITLGGGSEDGMALTAGDAWLDNFTIDAGAIVQ